MALDHYVTLGRSGLRVSPFCLGAMTFGNEWGFGVEPDEAARVIDAYLDRGGNFIDTANIYTKGHSEAILGDHLGCYKHKRDRVVLATKFMGNMYPGDPNGGGANRKAITNACEQSLRRLRTDHIDLYWMHFPDPYTPIDETMRALDDLVRAGKVLYLGFSDTPAWKCVQAQYEAIFKNWTPLIALQIEYSLLERTPEQELIPMALENGLGVTPWSPLKGGVLTGKYRRGNQKDADSASRGAWVANHLTDHTFDLLDVLAKIAKQVGCTPAQAALAWCQSREGVASTIVGAKTVEQLLSNLEALDVSLNEDQIAELDAASQPTEIFPHTFLPFVRNNIQGGTTIDGVPSEPWHLAPADDTERF